MLKLENLEVFNGQQQLNTEILPVSGELEPNVTKELGIKLQIPEGKSFDLIGLYLVYNREINFDVDTENDKPVDWERGDLWSGETVDVTVNHFDDKKKIYVALSRKSANSVFEGTFTLLNLYCRLDEISDTIKVWIEVRNL